MLRFPIVERRFRDTVSPGQVIGFRSYLAPSTRHERADLFNVRLDSQPMPYLSAITPVVTC